MMGAAHGERRSWWPPSVKTIFRDEAEKKRAYLIVSNALTYCDVLVLAL